MSSSITNYHIQPLSKDNYDTWRIQAQAILIKNKLWGHVSGINKKPDSDDEKIKIWEDSDLIARSDLFLIISPKELKQVKNCKTSSEVWTTLEGIYQSKGPARKATLLKRLILHKMTECDNLHEHINSFMDTVDKLAEMDIEINSELLSIMLLYSLPASFENFRVAIETRDTVPQPEELKVKILEEYEARKVASNEISNCRPTEGALFTNKKVNWVNNKKPINKNNDTENVEQTKRGKQKKFEFRCYKCNKPNHKARDCRARYFNDRKIDPSTHKAECCLNLRDEVKNNENKSAWCLDSGSTSHMCSEKMDF